MIERIIVDIGASPQQVFKFLVEYDKHYTEVSQDHIERVVKIVNPDLEHPDVSFYFRQISPISGKEQKIRGKVTRVAVNKYIGTVFLFPTSVFLSSVEEILEPSRRGCTLTTNMRFTFIARLAGNARRKVVEHIKRRARGDARHSRAGSAGRERICPANLSSSRTAEASRLVRIAASGSNTSSSHGERDVLEALAESGCNGPRATGLRTLSIPEPARAASISERDESLEAGGSMRTAADLDRFGGTRLDGWRILDAAKGVLVALRHCTLDEAFAEIVQTAKDHNAAPLELTHALVAVAANDLTADLNESTVLTVDAAWGALLGAPRDRLGQG